MIRTFKSKALRLFYEDDDRSKLPPDMVERIRTVLSALDAVGSPEDMDQPSFRFHALKGDLKGHFSVTVRANWGIIFKFADGNALGVDFIDYH